MANEIPTSILLCDMIAILGTSAMSIRSDSCDNSCVSKNCCSSGKFRSSSLPGTSAGTVALAGTSISGNCSSPSRNSSPSKKSCSGNSSPSRNISGNCSSPSRNISGNSSRCADCMNSRSAMTMMSGLAALFSYWSQP